MMDLMFKNDYDRQIDKVKLDMFDVYAYTIQLRAPGKYKKKGNDVNSWEKIFCCIVTTLE